MAAVSSSSHHSIGTSKSNGAGSSPAHVEFADDPLSPVVDRDISDSNLRRVASSDTASSIQTIQPSASASSSAALFGAERRESDGANSSPSEGPSNGPYHGAAVYKRTSSVDDGYKSGWAAYASTEHLNPNERSLEGDDYTRRGLSGRPTNGTAYIDSARPDAGESGEEEGDEAKQVQQNLERWAAAEKQRRKAARTSRSSFLGPPETGSLARRLTFGRKPNPASYVETQDSSPVDRNASLLRNVSGTAASISSSNDSILSDSRRGSADSGLKHDSQGSPVRAVADGHKSLDDVPEHDGDDGDNDTLSPRGHKNKGKARALDHVQSPFADPSDTTSQQQKRRSLKPTASRPIVTPGRAPSIRRTPADTPQIIATDVDAQQQSDRQQRRYSRNGTPLAAENPFLSASEAVQAAESGGHYRPRTHDAIQEDERDIGMPTMARATTWDSLSSTTSTVTTQQPSARYSMSKFREVGLDVSEGEEEESVPAPELERRRQLKRVMTGEDESSTTRSGRYDRRSREAEEDRRRVREGKGRQPWWTEWLCGCGRVVDDDNEQTGKTGPE